MSLANVLSQALRPAVPASVLAACTEHDRPVVENILYVTLEILPLLNLELATVENPKQTHYVITVPFSTEEISVDFATLRQIVNFSPCRIENLSVKSKNNKCSLVLEICDEKSRSSFSEFDVIRISKKRK